MANSLTMPTILAGDGSSDQSKRLTKGTPARSSYIGRLPAPTRVPLASDGYATGFVIFGARQARPARQRSSSARARPAVVMLMKIAIPRASGRWFTPSQAWHRGILIFQCRTRLPSCARCLWVNFHRAAVDPGPLCPTLRRKKQVASYRTRRGGDDDRATVFEIGSARENQFVDGPGGFPLLGHPVCVQLDVLQGKAAGRSNDPRGGARRLGLLPQDGCSTPSDGHGTEA